MPESLPTKVGSKNFFLYLFLILYIVFFVVFLSAFYGGANTVSCLDICPSIFDSKIFGPPVVFIFNFIAVFIGSAIYKKFVVSGIVLVLGVVYLFLWMILFKFNFYYILGFVPFLITWLSASKQSRTKH